MYFNCDRRSQLNPYRTSGFWTSRQITLAAKRRSGPGMQSAGGTAKHTAALYSATVENVIFLVLPALASFFSISALQLTNAGPLKQHARALWHCLRVSWEPMEYVQNAIHAMSENSVERVMCRTFKPIKI